DAEIQDSQDKFQKLLSTIEHELGTDLAGSTPANVAEEAADVDINQDQPKHEESAQTDFFA
ncbi:MAG: hypothetical protein VZR14_06835, partial [Hallerella sp.]|nr:hypothetical protein [Hallerella sp.]